MTKPAAQPQKTALVSCMRNEGIFLLEWVAYHQGLGFDAIIVVTNDCTDGSDALAETLADDGQIIHIDQTVPPGDSPQDAGMDLALDWMRRWALGLELVGPNLLRKRGGASAPPLRGASTAPGANP